MLGRPGAITGVLSTLRAGIAALILLLVLGGIAGHVFSPLDKRLTDARFGLVTRPPTGNTVFVEIDPASLRQVGVWPWPRTVYARLLDRLMALGAGETVLDVVAGKADDFVAEGRQLFRPALDGRVDQPNDRHGRRIDALALRAPFRGHSMREGRARHDDRDATGGARRVAVEGYGEAALGRRDTGLAVKALGQLNRQRSGRSAAASGVPMLFGVFQEIPHHAPRSLSMARSRPSKLSTMISAPASSSSTTA